MSQRISLALLPAFACCAAQLPGTAIREAVPDAEHQAAQEWRDSLNTPPGSLLAVETRLWICLNAALDAMPGSPMEQAALGEWVALTEGQDTSDAEKREACRTAAHLAIVCGKSQMGELAFSFFHKAQQYSERLMFAPALGASAPPAP